MFLLSIFLYFLTGGFAVKFFSIQKKDDPYVAFLAVLFWPGFLAVLTGILLADWLETALESRYSGKSDEKKDF